MTVTEKVAYIQGLYDGMGLDKSGSSEAKLISEMLDVLKEIGEELENMDASLDAMGEELDAVSDDLSDVEKVVFDEDDDGECCCGHDHGLDGELEPLEADCPNCGEHLLIDESVLEEGSIECPACGQKFAVSIEDEQEEE